MGFFKNAASMLLTSAVTMPIGVLSSVLLARCLAVPERGLFSVASSFIGIVSLVANLGWPAASIYRLKRIRSPPAQVASAGLAANLVISLLAIGAGVAFGPWFTARFLDEAPPLVLHLCLATVAVQLFFGLFSGLAKGIDRFDLRNWAAFGAATGRFLAIVGALLVVRGDFVTVLIATLAVQAVLTLVFGGAVLRRTGVARRVDVEEATSSLSYGFKSYLQNLGGELHDRIDIFMIAYLLDDPAQVAVYAIAAGVIQQIKLVPESIGLALFPRLAGSAEEEAGRFAAYVSRHSTLWVLVLALVLGAAAPVLIPLVYGAEYAPSVPVFFVLLPGMVLLTVYRVLARYFSALGRQQVNIALQLCSIALNIGLNFVLTPRLGVVGAACSSLASYTLAAVLVAVAFRVASRRSLAETFVFRRADLEPYRARWARLVARVRRAG